VKKQNQSLFILTFGDFEVKKGFDFFRAKEFVGTLVDS